jgi:hypothetical protein
MYAAPTAAYAVGIARTGRLSLPPIENAYWLGNLSFERDFPVPAILLSVLLEITGIPVDYAMFLAISAVAQFGFFALAKLVISGKEGANGTGIFVAALAYMYLTSFRLTVSYVGRGTLGVALLTQFMLAYALFLRNQLQNPKNSLSWLTVLLLFTLAVGYTYYFSLLGIFTLTSLTFLLVGAVALFSKRIVFRPPILPVVLTSFSLLIYGPFMNTMSRMAGAFALPTFFDNIVLYFKVLFRIEAPQDILLQRGFVQLDPLTMVTGYFLLNVVKVLSVIAVIYGLLAYRPRMGRKPKLIWLFCLAVLFLSFAESGYLFVTVAAPLRFISMYGSIVLLSFVMKLAPKMKGNSRASHSAMRFRYGLRASAVCLLLVVLILSSYGSIRTDWYYGTAKPYANEKVQPLATFLLSHSTDSAPALLTGDADYAANIFYIASTHSAYSRLMAEPLETDTLVLYGALLTGASANLTDRMRDRGLFLLLTVNDARPVWGDEWGYGFLLPGSHPLNMTLIYNDGTTRLYTVG